MNYLKSGEGMSRRHDEAMDKLKPLTPKSERQYPGRIAPVGIPDFGCPSRKCVRKQGHAGECWPK